MTIQIILLVISLLVLAKSADKLVDSASIVATKLGIQPVTIGIFLLGLGTSVPEIAVSILSSIQHKEDLAVGNVIGSNIANVGLVLGLTAIIAPLVVNYAAIRFEMTVMLVISFIVTLLFWWGQGLDAIDGIVLVTMLVLALILITKRGGASPETPSYSEANEQRLTKTILVTIVSLTLLIASAQLLVYSGSNIARLMGLSELVIGLTIVALGTSLPELIVSITSALKKHSEMILGNIIGSNIFNLLAVLPFPAILGGYIIPQKTLQIDITLMLALTVLLSMVIKLGSKRLGRTIGMVFLLSYVSYIVYLLI